MKLSPFEMLARAVLMQAAEDAKRMERKSAASNFKASETTGVRPRDATKVRVPREQY